MMGLNVDVFIGKELKFAKRLHVLYRIENDFEESHLFVLGYSNP